MEEKWKDIKGYEGAYQVSTSGRVKRLERIVTNRNGRMYRLNELIMSQYKGTNGYMAIKIGYQGLIKHHSVHRLVAHAFIENKNGLTEVNHKDENKINNNVDNLEWCTPEYNQNYGTRIERITAKQHRKSVIQLDIKGNIINCYKSTLEAAKLTGITRQGISGACHGFYKQYNGFLWRFN